MILESKCRTASDKDVQYVDSAWSPSDSARNMECGPQLTFTILLPACIKLTHVFCRSLMIC